MGIKQDVFGLEQIYRLQVEGQWSTRGDVWNTPSPFFGPSSLSIGYPNGYFSGGYQPANSPNFPSSVYYSTVARIDYSNDTTTVPARGSLNNVRYSHAGTGNASFGYVGGGSPYVGGGSGDYKTDVERIDYSNDTATASVRGPQVFGLYSRAATGNVSFGYFAGGVGIPPGERSSVDRIDYSNDSATSVAKGPLNTARMLVSATGNQDFGYVGGGSPQQTNAPKSTVDRIDYSNDTATASPKGPLSVVRRETGATGNASFGYFGGGYNAVPGSNNWLSTIDRIDYSNDTATASPKGPLSRTRGFGCATGDSSFGYFGGGEGNNNENLSALDRLDYSNDTATTVDKGPLSYSLRNSAASSSKQNANPVQTLQPASSPRPNIASAGTDFGYFGGGFTGSAVLSRVERIDYSNDTTVETKGPLSAARRYFGATGNAFFGYFIGGSDNPSSTKFSTVDRVDYSNDTPTAVAKGPLASVRSNFGATGNANFGYVGGGNPGAVSTVDRIDYSNDTAATAPKGPLSAGRYNVIATGNQNFGYFGGGSHPVVSTVDRVDYSNDTATAVAKGPLSAVKRYHAATGNASFGYFGGGFSSSTISTVDRVDYSNDTATAVAKGPLGTAIERIGATGNTSFGYFAGGSPSHSSTNRVDYSNDTATALAKGPLSAPRQSLTASSSRANAMPSKGPGNLEVPVAFGAFSAPGPVPAGTDFGYMVGGFAGSYPSPSTVVDRIDYSNDTATASAKGSLTAGASYTTGVASLTHGYTLGGITANHVSTVNRIDFANDTANSVLRGPLSQTRYRSHAATGNKDFGYIGGGDTPGTSSSIDRIDYSNDSATSVVKGPLTSTRYLLSATGNASFGYFGGGNPSPNLAKVDRIDYANDTATASPKGDLSLGRRKLAATGTANFGYFASGTSPSNTVVDRVDYSNDTATASPKGPTAYQGSNPGSASSVTHGYFGGGSPGTLSSVQRIDYANDTATATIKGPLTQSRWGLAGMSPKDAGLPKTEIGTVNYAAGTFATPNTGYFGGGAPSPNPFSTVDRIDYSNDTATAAEKGPLSNGRNQLAATGNQSFGYFGGGESPSGRVSTVDRIDYLNDTANALTKGPLSAAKSGVTATGNPSFGYFGGGFPPSNTPISTIDRIDYSSDTATASPKGPLSLYRRYFAATSNADFGYFGGGFDPSARSTVDRIDYNNDTATAVAKGPLPVAKYHLAATGNADFGYFGGGKTPSSPALSTVDRIDYTNDTATASPKGPLSSARAYIAAVGNLNFGYFGGGSVVSTVDRIDYTNDTATASPKGPLSLARRELGATSARANGFVPIGPSVVSNAPVQTGMQDYRGYIFGGSNPAFSPSSNEPPQRIDFLNDTATAVVRGTPAGGLYYNFAVGNRNYAYAANIGNPSPASVQRFDYSNETAAMVFKGAYNTVLIGDGGPTSSVGGFNASATGNHDYGWTNGGGKLYSVPAPSGYYVAFSQIDRIDYSNDTANASRRSYTTNRFGTGSATGTNNYGYWMGGSTNMTTPSGTSTKVDRTDYASDTTNAVAKGNLSAVHGNASDSIGNSSYGWVAGGRPYMAQQK